MPPLVLDATAVAVGGDAVSRDGDGRVVFVRGALPGERVLAEVVDEHRTFARAVTTEVLVASGDRRPPPCAHATEGCGGCGWQHVAPEAQRRLKRDIVAETLERLGGITDPVVAIGKGLGPVAARTTVRAAVVAGRAGYRRLRSHDVLVVDECLIADPLVAEMLVEGRFGSATEVVLRAGARTGQRLAVVTPTADDVRLPDDVAVVGADQLRSGRRAWYHEEVAGRRWRISASSFFQPRPDGAEALIALILDAVSEQAPDARRILDLCCGVGLFAGALAAPTRAILGVEPHRPAVVDARHNLSGLDVHLVRSSLERWRPSAADAVVVDPPRSGLGRAGVAAVAATGATACVLVSCDPGSLGRDASLLRARDFRHVRSTLVDLFPHTPRVEVVTTFDRSEPSQRRQDR